MMNTYPENDYRGYLMHWGKGKEAKSHKYISRHKGKNGKWIYIYKKVDSKTLPGELITTDSKQNTGEDDVAINLHPEPDGRIDEDGRIIRRDSKISKLSRALAKPINTIVRKHKLNKARSEISKKVFNKYDNYALNNQTPKGGMTLIDKKGKKKETLNVEEYKRKRKKLVKKYAHKNSVDKNKPWTPSSRSDAGN